MAEMYEEPTDTLYIEDINVRENKQKLLVFGYIINQRIGQYLTKKEREQ